MKKLQKLSVLIFCTILLLNSSELFSLPFYPLSKSSSTMLRSNSGDPKLNMIVFYGGVAGGGKQNTCYFAKTKLTLLNKFNLDGSYFYNINHDQLYSANFSFGNILAFSLGMEWGDRPYFFSGDSTFQKITIKNVATGQDAFYSTFSDYSIPQRINSYTAGFCLNPRFVKENFWRGKGDCWMLINLKWELMYAPSVGYDKTFDFTTEGVYEAKTETYSLENVEIKHWGFRMVFDTRLSSKIGMMIETGMRPGIKRGINEQGTFSNGYIRMGVAVGIAVGGRKAMHAAD